jgi:hypothetical protein
MDCLFAGDYSSIHAFNHIGLLVPFFNRSIQTRLPQLEKNNKLKIYVLLPKTLNVQWATILDFAIIFGGPHEVQGTMLSVTTDFSIESVLCIFGIDA